MPITQALNSKANIKKITNEDLPFAPQQPVIASYYATSTAGQTVINLSFSVDTTNSDIFWLFVDGKKLDLGSSNDYTFTAIGADLTSAQITLNQSLPINLNIQAFKLGLKKESEFLTDNRFVQLYAAESAGFQGFIDTTSTLITATTTTGTPAAGTFYSSISGRASMLDLSQDLKARMAVDRISVQQVQLLQNEFGPAGEYVFSTNNDTFGQIRFVGFGWGNAFGASGVAAFTSTSGDYVEITFYGTGLNLLDQVDGNARSYLWSVDGGATTASSVTTPSGVLNNRGYPMNIVRNMVNGLTLGIHTVKIQNNSAFVLTVFGFEVLNESSSVKVNPGISYIQGKKYTTSAQSVFSYSAPVTGSRGGRVLIYQNGDGSIGQAFQAVNGSQANLSSADHTNEELIRTYNWREFGANRTGPDDYSTLQTAATNVSFVLDDGTTSLQGFQQTMVASERVGYGGTVNSITFTFVGTGCDITVLAAGSLDTYTALVDGVSIGTITLSVFNTEQLFKLVSGLQYGTHTIQINRTTAAANTLQFKNFKVYIPKKPTLPSGSVEIADYNVMANFTANATADYRPAVGVLRKAATREITYSGTWTATSNVSEVSGYNVASTTNGDFLQYQFFGTAFELRFGNNTGTTSNWTMTLDGVNNLTVTNGTFWTGSLTTSKYGTGITSFTASTGVAVLASVASNANGISVSGLNLGLHTIKFAKSNAGTSPFNFSAIDVACPIHSFRSNLYLDLQNTLSIGNQSISDNRKITPIKDSILAQKNFTQAVGVSSGPTTASTSAVPMPDMSATIKTNGRPIRASLSAQVFSSAAGAQIIYSIYVDGVNVVPGGGFTLNSAVATDDETVAVSLIIPVTAGFHKVDAYWWTNTGTLTANGIQRILTVEEV